MIKQINLTEPQSGTKAEFHITSNRPYGGTTNQWNVDSTAVKVIVSDEGFDALKQSWNELAIESDTCIFQTFEWNRIWWNHFGKEKKLHIITIYHENQLIGIAPFFEDEMVLFGNIVLSTLRLLGSYVNQPEGDPLEGNISYSDYLDCIIKPDFEHTFYPILVLHLNDIKSNFDEIKMEEIPESSSVVSIMLPLITKSDYSMRYQIEQGSSSPVIELNKTWESYLSSLSVKDRYNAKRYYKRSIIGNKKSFNIKKLTQIESLPDVLNNLFRMHQIQWNNRGYAGTFSETRMRNFLTDISETFFEKGWIQFNMAVPVHLEHRIVALDVILTYKKRIYLMHRGMDEDPEYRNMGPGNVLLYAKIQEAISQGVEVFDMLRGSEDFKLRIATTIHQNKIIHIFSDRKTTNLLPWLAKTYLKILRFYRNEQTHVKILLSDKSILNGIATYVQFMKTRIQQKLHP